VLPADADLLDIATERFAYIFKDKGDLDEMLFLGVTEGRQLFMLGFPTPSPELKIRVYDTMRRIFKQLDVVTYAHACEVWYTTQKCVEGQQINIAPPSRDPQRTEASVCGRQGRTGALRPSRHSSRRPGSSYTVAVVRGFCRSCWPPLLNYWNPNRIRHGSEGRSPR
jgi:hypothetical protein